MPKRCRVEDVHGLPDERLGSERVIQNPILVTFPRGTNPTGPEKANLKLFPDTQNRNDSNEGRTEVLVCNANGSEWEGKTGSTQFPALYYAALRSKKTGKIRFIEIDSHFAMRPRLLQAPQLEEPEDESAANTSNKNRYEKREDLLKTFGGSRARQRYNAFRRDEIRDGVVKKQYAEAVVEAAAKQHADDKKNVEEEDETTRRLAPPHNMEATSADLAYPLDGLMSPHEWNAIKKQADDLLLQYDREKQAKQKKPNGWHGITWKFLFQVLGDDNIDASTKHTRIMATLYLNILISLAKCRRRVARSDRKHLKKDLDIDEEHVSSLLERFTETMYKPDGTIFQEKSVATGDKLCYFAIVVWLTIAGFVHCGNMGELAQALEVTSKNLAQCAVLVGGKLHKKKSQERDYAGFTVTLRVPLKFPPLNRRKTKFSSRRRPVP